MKPFVLWIVHTISGALHVITRLLILPRVCRKFVIVSVTILYLRMRLDYFLNFKEKMGNKSG